MSEHISRFPVTDRGQTQAVQVPPKAPVASVAAEPGNPHDPTMEARLASIEQGNAEIRQLLRDLAPKIEDLAGFAKFGAPHLAAKADLTSAEGRLRDEIQATKTDLIGMEGRLRDEIQATKTDIVGMEGRLREEIQKRPTRRQAISDIAWIVGLIGAVLTVGSRLAH